MASKHLVKIGLALVKRNRLLVVRKKGTQAFILPGGKPEDGEDDLEALQRELREELGCGVADVRFERCFTDTAAGIVDTTITVRLYLGSLNGTPHPASEIEELGWAAVCGPPDLPLAPSILNQILPYLCARRGVKRLPR